VGRYDLADQRAFAEGQPVFALPDAVGVVTLTGPDALRLVSALTTLPPQTPPAAAGSQALLLDAQGHVLFGLAVAAGEAGSAAGDGLTILTDGSADALADLINSRRFRWRAEANSRPELKTLITPTPLNGLRTPMIRDAWPAGAPDATWRYPRYSLVSPHPGVAWTGLTTYIYDPANAPALPRQFESRRRRQIDAAVLEGLRVAAWRPLASREAADGRTVPHELDWLRATTPLNAGCYPGQETVAKIINVGRPPRRLVLLHQDGSDAVLPAPGAGVCAMAAAGQATRQGEPADGIGGWSQVGRITSTGMHYELGPIALALVKRTLPEDAGLAVVAPGAPGGMIAASQTVIVPAGGESDARPVRRLAPPKLARRRQT
jgi:folate-binding protein YgfZ